MKSFRAAAAAVFALACLAPAMPAAAERAVVSARVETGDLDLASQAGQRTLRQRLRVATELACGDASRTADMAADLGRCRAEMHRSGAAQIAARRADPSVTVTPDSAGQ